jgi:hypothetical protein
MKAHIVYTKLDGKPVLLFDNRTPSAVILDNFIPKGFDIYGIRHTDDDTERPASVEARVVVNRWGGLMSFPSDDPSVKKEAYINLSSEESDRFKEAMRYDNERDIEESDEPMVLVPLSYLMDLIKGKT